MIKFFLCALICIYTTASLYAAETRGLSVVAKDTTTNQTGEVKLYNKTYAVIIGIDVYQSLPRDRQLKNAVSDAKAVEDVLNRNFHFDKIIHLYDQEATKDRILEVLTETLPTQMTDQDSLFLFWAGHGDQELGSQGKEIGYLIPFDGEVGKIRKNLTMTELRDTVSAKLPAKHVFYVMDACYGGLLASTRAVDKQSRHDLSYLREITRETVRQVLTAGGKGEEVLDGGYKGHSVFTGRLIQALESAGDYITANEIQTILREKVYGDSKAMGQGKTQTPAFGTLSGSGDYVFVPNIEQKAKDNQAEVTKLEDELKRLEAQESEATKYQTEQEQREARQKRQVAEARLKAEQFRQQQLVDETRRQREMAAERVLFENEQKQREEATTSAQKAEEQRLASLKAVLAKKKLAAPAASTRTLAAAVAEIKRLNAEIESIESAYDSELSGGKGRITTRYNAEINAVQQASKSKQAPIERDEFESETEFKTRIAKQQSSYSDRISELERKRQKEINELEQGLSNEQQKQTADLRQSLKILANNEFIVGAESLAMELGQYNPDKQVFPITLKSTAPYTKVAMNGDLPLPRDEARKFKQEFNSGLVRPQVILKAGSGELVTASLANDSDNSIYEYVNGEFITVVARNQREMERERQSMGEMVNVPAGCFSPNNTKVCLDTFRIGKYLVTQAQWQRIMGSNPSHFSSCGDNCPVENVSWNMAQEFLQKLNRQSGKHYRLPTEAEWHYACTSGGKNEVFCGGDDVDAVAWYDTNSGGRTHPVGQKQPNGFGLYDMSGNVWEWMSDWYGGSYSLGGRNPTGPLAGSEKVLRGGSWNASFVYTQVVLRYNITPASGTSYSGLRLVVSED